MDPNPAPSEPQVLPELILPGDVEIIWVDKDLATATEDSAVTRSSGADDSMLKVLVLFSYY